ncbi:MAG: hypothetical protein KAV87_12720 [Desulfobacteraceae bacterium]|nr:hypothetical protein [Desulfobacteraceae bacterium]
MRIEHKNCLQTYLGNWLMAMDVKARAEGKPSSGLRVPQPLQSLMRHELNLCLMLELFDERLTRFEKSLNGKKEDYDYGAHSEAITFLDAIYLFSRILLDSAAGVVRHYYNCNNRGRELDKSFNDLYKKSVNGELPNNLNKVFSECEAWFPQLKARRDDIVHRYEIYFIGFRRNSNGETAALQISHRENTHAISDEVLRSDLRSYIGMVMAGYQRFVDGLLDYWDEMFRSWYSISVFRHSTPLLGRSANILWWAYRYGEYRNDNMVVKS